MGSIFKAPKMPAPPQMVMPSTDDVPDAEDEALQAAEAEEQRKRDRNRRSEEHTSERV